MAETYFCVLNQQQYPSDVKLGTAPIALAKVLEGLKSAKVVKIESNAGTVAEAIEICKTAYPEHVTGPPIVVTAAAWKES